MPDLHLTDSEQAALHALLAAEPVAGMLPSYEVLENVAALIPCDAIAVEIADPSGCLVQLVCLPTGDYDGGPLVACDGSPPVGIVHKALDPEQRRRLAAHGSTDGLVVGFRDGRNHITRLGLDRGKPPFSERDLAVLRMIAPALKRLLRHQPTPTRTATLTTQERRVLQLLTTGLSNTEIADRLYVAPCTIRKHLEHAFRKLGVTNRLAAVIAFERRDTIGPIGSIAAKDTPERE
jgi:DNA-binding CsgD family transcriptional regulator